MGLRFIFVYLMKHLKLWYTSENICAKAKYCFAAVVFSFSDSIDMSVNHKLACTAALSRAAQGPHNGTCQERGRQKALSLQEIKCWVSPPCARGVGGLRTENALHGLGGYI